MAGAINEVKKHNKEHEKKKQGGFNTTEESDEVEGLTIG